MSDEVMALQEEAKQYLESIEDKLLSTGILTTATGDNEADVSINVAQWSGDVCVVVSIESENNPSMEEDDYEPISDYVNEKIFDGESFLPSTAFEPLEEAINNGFIVLVNDKQVY